jgi:phosphoesterase RecJ-like protein
MTAFVGSAAEIADVIRDARRIALVGHVTPDADCVASIAAVWLALRELGKEVHAILPDGTVSRRMQYLVRRAGLTPATLGQAQGCDLALVLDTAKAPRVNVPGKLEALPGMPVANVDHHATNAAFGCWNWVVPAASSTSELAYTLLRSLGCRITPTIATLLYAGIHSDTQGFSLSNTGAASLDVAHELAAAGAAIADVCEQLHRSHSRSEFELLKVVYAHTQVSDDGRLAWSCASHAEIAATGCAASDIDDQVEVVRSIEGVRVAILFTEGVRGKVRMNFRGEKGIPVLELAARFGGGGHAESAGAILDGAIGETVERVIPAALEFVRELPPGPPA